MSDDKKIIDSENIEDLMPVYLNSAAKGDVVAMRNLGDVFYLGIVGEKDYSKAVFWYSKAAENNDAVSINRLASIYLEGKPSQNDINKAEELLIKAAELGNSAAINNLGLLYREDVYGKQDIEKAKKWFEKAKDCGNEHALFNLGVLYFDLDRLDEGFDLIEQSIKKSSTKAMLFMGAIYYTGNKVDIDKKKAFHYFGLAAEKDDIDGLNSVAYMLEYGDGIEENKAKAAFFRKRVKQLKGV